MGPLTCPRRLLGAVSISLTHVASATKQCSSYLLQVLRLRRKLGPHGKLASAREITNRMGGDIFDLRPV